MSTTTTSSQSSTAQQHPSDKRGIISSFFNLIGRILGVLIFSAVMSVIMEWIGMTWWFTEDYQGYEHAQEMFDSELSYLNASARDGALDSYAAVQANEYVQTAISVTFFESGFMDWIRSSYIIQPNDNDVVAFFKSIQASIYDYLIAMVFTLMTFMVRVTILTLSLPVFLMFGLVGLADGLMKRDIRRFTGGHESSFVYHIAKGFSVPFLVFGWIIYLAMPVSIHPNFVITPFAVMFAFAIFITASKFKKYL